MEAHKITNMDYNVVKEKNFHTLNEMLSLTPQTEVNE